MSDAALNRHLDEIDRQDREAAAVDQLVQMWLSHPEKINAAWSLVLLERQPDLLKLLSERSMRSGQFSGADELAGNMVFLDALDEMLTEALAQMAQDHLQAEADQAEVDAALDAAEDRYWHE